MKQIGKNRQQIHKLFRARELMTAAVLIVALFVTFKLWQTAEHSAEQALQTAFDFRVGESNDRIQQRMSVYEQILRATLGFFNASDYVSRQDFRVFVSSLSLTENFPGIQGIGFSRVVAPENKAEHIAAIRKEGFPDYTIKPDGPRDMYTSIVYLEPFSGRNLRAFGYDMFSDPVRRMAMEEARDSGAPALSGKVILVQETGSKVQSGFLMYLPLYRIGAAHNTQGQRRENLAGWVYAPFRMNDFMRGIAGENTNDLDIEIYDGMRVSEETRMYDADESVSAVALNRNLSSVRQILIGNRVWTVAITALPAFEERLRSDRPQLILQAGVSISLLIALLIWIFLDDRARALQAADQAMQLALYDALTGLPNRKLLEERLGQALAHARRSQGECALLFIDLDKFKPINDNYGHAYGDLLLKDVAKRLQSCMRESDTASRLGGDEFVALLSEVDGEEAVKLVASKILDRLTMPYHISGHEFSISASIGAAVFPRHGSDSKTLIKNADLAMYDAKHAGRGTIRFARPSGTPPQQSDVRA